MRAAVLTLASILLTLPVGRPCRAGDGGAPLGGWWAAAQAELVRSEYDVRWQDGTPLEGGGAYAAPNRAHHLRSFFGDEGVRVVPRTGDTAAWRWGLRLRAAGVDGRPRAVEGGSVATEGPRFEVRRAGLTEWYLNSPRGLEQGFTLYAPAWPEPVGPSPWTVLRLEIAGDLVPTLDPSSQTVSFASPAGVAVLDYGALVAVDAIGRTLPARFALAGRTLDLLVDARDAVPPVTIDPLATGAAWAVEGNADLALLGYSVATAGDVDGDGYSDVVVGVPQYDGGQLDEGRVSVFTGSASGLSITPRWSYESDQASAKLGISVGTAGDVNGDHYSDVVAGAYLWDGGENNEGAAFVFLGGTTCCGAPVRLEADQAAAEFGAAVSTAGDVDGDGYSEVIVGAARYDGVGHPDTGRAYVYRGGPSGIATTPVRFYEGTQAGEHFGVSVGWAGDVNGDGYGDLVVGADLYHDPDPEEGAAFVYHGSAGGPGVAPASVLEANHGSAHVGRSVGTAGDVNGDGFADVIVGADLYDDDQTDEGGALVFLGSALGAATTPAWTVTSNQPGSGFGTSVGTAGDVNGDGYADVIVGAPGWDEGGYSGAGRAFAYLGGASGLATTPIWQTGPSLLAAAFGHAVGTAGDVNADGFADVIVGAPFYDGGQDAEGRASVFLGSPAGLADAAGWTADANQAEAHLGLALAGAGDVNGDGFGDVLVAAPDYDAGQSGEGRAFLYLGAASGLAPFPIWTQESNVALGRFGRSLGGAGDVNGDGFADVIVASATGVFVHYGNASGLGAGAVWLLAFSGDDPVGGAGDVNGDGYADVFLGARVFHGGPLGLGAAESWSATLEQACGPLAGGACPDLGHGAAGAGDVNRDGYSDLVLGAPGWDTGYEDAGRALLYLGGPAGLAATAAWSADLGSPIVGTAGSGFGSVVAGAGDVNGDGYADVLVGAPSHDACSFGLGCRVNAGEARLYYGDASGLEASVGWSSGGTVDGTFYGASLAGADVNGDGYSDVIAGASGELSGRGTVRLLLGRSERGLDTFSARSISPGVTDDVHFGARAANAGDVNGDGYADVLVAAPYFDDGETDEGRAFLFYGNGGAGIALNPRQRSGNDVEPVAILGRSHTAGSVLLALLARTPFGWGDVQLEWEVQRFDVPFVGVGQRSPGWTPTGRLGADLRRTVTGLQDGMPYHWRVRLRHRMSNLPLAPRTSRWLTLGGNAASEWDVRIGVADVDGDGVHDTKDNCPLAPNPDQLDRGGLGAGSARDFIGDACQCGDVNGDGFVTIADSVIVTRSLLEPPAAVQSRPELCDVGASNGCSLSDAVLIRRALLVPPTVGIAQVCEPAAP